MDELHQRRKREHIQICAEQDVEHSRRSSGFEAVTLPHVALPELSWEDLDPSTEFLGRRFSFPFLITGMTGGVERAAVINHRLATAAERWNIPMGVGSQRLALENPHHADIFTLKKQHPNLFLIGNIGIGQLTKPDALDLCRRAVSMIEADALAIHVNVLQELVQTEGDRDFRGIIKKIGLIAQRLEVPLLIKEVGAGMDPVTVKRLYEEGVRAVDVGGTGGTSWAYIEGLRAHQSAVQRLGKVFRDVGLSTSEALQKATDLRLPGISFVATGGIRDGLTALKAIYSGATMVGIGLPLFRAALESLEGPSHELESFVLELKTAMMCAAIQKLSTIS